MWIDSLLTIHLPPPTHTHALQEVYKDASSQVHTLRRMVKEKDEAIQKQGDLEKKIQALEMQKNPGEFLASPTSAPTLLPGGEGGTGMSNGTGHNNVGVVPGVPSLPPPPVAAGSGKQSSQPITECVTE